MLRTLLVWTTIVLSTTILGILAFFTFPFDRGGDVVHLYARLWGKSILWASGVKVKVRGLEKITSRGPYIFMSNHLSAYDIFVLLAHLPLQFRWLAKAELFRIPIFGWAMSTAGYISLDRSSPRRAYRSMEEAARRIHEGVSVVIFPEGTRSRDGRLGPFMKGGFTLAVKAQVPVVPLAIKGTYEIMPPHTKKVLSRGEVVVVIGDPIETEGLSLRDRDKLMEEVRRGIEEALKEAGA